MNTIKSAILINSSRQEIWKFLSNAEMLCDWLADSADVEMVESGSWKIESTIPLVAGDHRVLECIEGEKLKLQWNHQGFPTLVEIDLVDHNGKSAMNVVHTIEGEPPYEIDDSMGGKAGQIREMWVYVLGLFKTRLELGEAKALLNPKRKPEKAVTHILNLQANPEKVFEAIVEPEKIKQWNPFAPNAEVEKKEGGNYSFGWESEQTGKDGPGEVVEYEAGRKITYTWHGNPPTLVTWEVQPLGADSQYNTQLKLVHSGFIKDQNMLVDWNLGWGAFLQSFAMLVEKDIESNWFGESFGGVQ